MANIPRVAAMASGGCHLDVWATLTSANNVGDPTCRPGASDRSVSIVFATAGAGTLTIEGCLDPADTPLATLNSTSIWFPLTDPQGNNIAKTASALEAISENVVWLRPRLSGASTDVVNVSVLSRGTRG